MYLDASYRYCSIVLSLPLGDALQKLSNKSFIHPHENMCGVKSQMVITMVGRQTERPSLSGVQL